MGFESAKQQVIQALQNRQFRHERRTGERKNLLELGEVSIEQAIEILGRTKGQEATSSSSHYDSSIEVWIFRPTDWYIKFYLVDQCWFISFHQ